MAIFTMIFYHFISCVFFYFISFIKQKTRYTEREGQIYAMRYRVSVS